MRFAFFILAFLFALEPLPAATAPVSVPRANAMQDARAPATPNATQAGQTVQAHLWETVLDLLPTLMTRGRGVPGTWQCPGGNAHRGCDPERNHQPFRCNDGDYSRACANPYHRPPHGDASPNHNVTASAAPQIDAAQKDRSAGSTQVRSDLKAAHGPLGILGERTIHEGDDRDAALGDRKDNGSITAGNPDPPYQARGSVDELAVHKGDDRDAMLGNRKDNGSITAGNPNPPYESREELRDPPKTKGPHQHCGSYARGCRGPPTQGGRS